MIVDSSDLLAFAYAPWGVSASVLLLRLRCAFTFTLQDVPVEALTTVKPYCNEVHAQAQLWLKRDPKASYEAWKKCLPIRGVSVSVRLGKSISPAPVLRALKSPLPFPYLSLFPFVCQGSMAMGSPPAKQSSAISI